MSVNGTGRLRRVLVRQPGDGERWREYGWRAEPDPSRLAAEHDAFCAALQDAGAEVVAAEPLPGNPDAIYVADPALLTDEGAVLLRLGKALRRGEVEPLANELHRLGIATVARLAGDELAEGGDALARRAHAARRARLPHERRRDRRAAGGASRRRRAGVRPPPPARSGECLHLLSLLSPLDGDLVVAFLPLLPVRLVELLRERGISIVEVPEEELDSLGPNVLALAPRVALALAGNDGTRLRMEAAGVEVLVYEGEELSRKGDGGPTCLTRPLERG